MSEKDLAQNGEIEVQIEEDGTRTVEYRGETVVVPSMEVVIQYVQ